MPTTTDGRISKIKLPNGKVYDVGSGGSGTVDSTWVANSTNPVESQLIQNTKPGLINTTTHGEAFGNNTTSNASGSYSHVEGASNTASGDYSHAQNYYTIAASDNQTAMGKYNVSDANDTYALIIGNGTATNARSNALAIDWDGKIYTGNSTTGYSIAELKSMIDAKKDNNWGFLYNDNSTWSNGPWYKIADTSITATHTDTNIVLRFQRAWNNTGISYGTLVVHARTNQNDTGISSIQARWRDAGANLPYDQCVVTYTSNTSGGSTIQIWTKLQVRYDAYCYEKEVDDSRQSMTDNWTLYSYRNTDGETSYPTTQTVLQPSFGQQSLNQLTFYYDNFSTATSSSRYQKITFVSMDVEDSSMTSDKIIYIPKENGTLALVSDVENATTVNSVSGTNGSVRFDYVENSEHKIGIDDGLQYNQTTGTSSVEGVSQLVLGNSTQSGTAGNKTGSLKIYNSGGRCGIIDHDSNVKNTTVHLPADSGTLALQSEVSAVDTAAQGYANTAKNDAKTYTDGEIDTLKSEYGTTWNDRSDWASQPWYPIATMQVTTTYTNVTLALHIQRGNGASQKSVGTFVVTARVNASLDNVTSFNSVWTNVEDGLLSDDTYYKVRATCMKQTGYTQFTVWLKLSTQYDSFSYRKIRGAYRNSQDKNGFDSDCWEINSFKNINGYALYHSGDNVIQCVPTFGNTVKSSLSFMYNDTSSYEEGTSSNPVYVNHGSVKLSTDDVSGTHTDYTIKLPKKNGTMALLSDIPSVPTDYIPLGGTSSNDPVTGKIEFTGSSSYLLFDTNNTGIRFIDSSSDEFSGVAWNGSNFWIGARSGSQPAHAGKTYISTGWDTTNSVGYNTIALSIPRAKDGTTTAVTRYVIHTGDNTFNAEDTLDEAKEIKLNNSSYSKDIRFRATNSHSDLWFGTFASSNDGGGIYNITGGGFVMKSSTASGSLVNTFYGNATSADSAGAVTVTDISDTTTEKTYRITQSPTTTGTGRNQYSSAGLQVVTRHNYYTRLEMGNTSENAVLRLYGSGTYYTNIEAGAPTANRTITFPDKTGTVALTSDIQTSAVTNSTVSTSGSGNAITSLTITSGQIVATKGSTFMAASGNTSMSNTFEPQTNYGANLGSTNHRFNNLYARYINGDAPTSSVTSGSTALVTSGGVYSFLEPTIVTPTKAAGCTGSLKHLIYYYPALNLVVGRVHATIQALSANKNTAIFNIPSTYKPNSNSAPVYIAHNKGSTGLRGWISSTASSGYVAMSVNTQTALATGDIEIAFSYVPATSLSVIS